MLTYDNNIVIVPAIHTHRHMQTLEFFFYDDHHGATYGRNKLISD